jgi:large subunit ribosomal protein L10e
MAGLRKGHCYTKYKRAYTRKSKFKKKGYVKGVPNSKISRFVTGDKIGGFTHKVHLIAKENIIIRHNSIESSRQVVARVLNNKLTVKDYQFKIRMYPHHVLRENKMLTGAGADRMQTGMQRAFGRPIGVAARVKKKQEVFTIYLNEENVKVAREALAKAPSRLPGRYGIEVENPKK